MRLSTPFSVLLVFGLAALLPSSGLAGCPEGKSPITILTPSGKMKILCVPPQAIQGIEEAADHSGGTVVSETCPCFSQNDLDAAGVLSCTDAPDRAFIFCENWDGTSFRAEGGFGPVDYRQCEIKTPSESIVENISIDELNACLALLEGVPPVGK